MQPSLADRFAIAIECLCEHYDQSAREGELIGLGLMCGDAVDLFWPLLLSSSELPLDCHDDYRFNPVDWDNNEGFHCFDELNKTLKCVCVPQDDPGFPGYVRSVFDSCIEALSRLNLRTRYGENLFTTMGGADPTSLLEMEERRFVEETNTSKLVDMWLEDFA